MFAIRVVIIDNVKGKAILIEQTRRELQDGSLIEQVIWQVPTLVPPTTHGFKYRLVFIRNKVRVLGFDNEHGKGDHMHLDGQELPYTFIDIDHLRADFIREIKKRGAK